MSPTKKASSVPGLRNALAAGGPAPQVAENVGETINLPPRPPKPVRFTLDLVREQHRFLKDFALDADVEASRVMRALLDELRDNPTLAVRVRAAVHQQQSASHFS